MITTVGYELLADIFTGESSDTLTKLSIGSGTTAEARSDTALDEAYADNGFEPATVTGSYAASVLTFSHVFTNTGTEDRVVREAGLVSAAGVLVYRKVFTDLEIQNFCIVPPGKSITIGVTLAFVDASSLAGLAGGETITYSVSVTATASGTIDPATFGTPGAICYNGIVLPNAGIPQFSEALGAKSWDFTCYTQDYSELQLILRYAGPVQVGNSITGRQYVTSSFRAGVLAIKNMSTLVHDLYLNCYVQGPIVPKPFGDGWWFDVRVVQSAYNEAV